MAATGTSAIPYYQDFSFKVNLGETKIGRFEIFGLGGKSNIDFLGDEIDENDLFADPSQDAFVENELGLVGLAHTLRLSKNTYVKTSFGASTNYNQYLQDNRLFDDNDQLVGKYRATSVRNRENRYTVTSTLNTKFNARWSLRAGFLNEMYDMNLFAEDRDDRVSIPDSDNDMVPDYFLTTTDVDEQFNLLQVYGQAEYKLTDNLSTNIWAS